MDRMRRHLLQAALAGLALGAARARAGEALLFGATPVILDEQAQFLSAWQGYLEARLHRPVRFVQRGSYREIVVLLLTGKLDFAWLCGYPYVRYKKQLELVAVPLYLGEPLYRSYLITPSDDRVTRGIQDLRERVFAFSDPDSNSGWLVPQAELKRQGIDSAYFFSRSFYTWGHRRVIQAVGAGLAQGGAVDGYIWDTLSVLHPELTRATRIAWRSEPFGFPPIVAAQGQPSGAVEQMRKVLTDMASDATGRTLLASLNLNGFVRGDPQLFDGIEANWHFLERRSSANIGSNGGSAG